MKNNTEYNELAKAKVTDSRNIVISTCNKGGFTIAQQLQAKEGSKITSVFMKGAFHIEDIDGLHNLRDAINLAIKTVEESGKEEADWD